jgi:drug/metabolite transporter (DMT)-like permease
LRLTFFTGQMHKGTKGHIYLMLVLAMVFWGLSFVWFKQANSNFGPITIIFFRLSLSIPVIFVFWLFFGKNKLPEKKDIKFFFLLAFFEPFLYFLAESYGLLYISSTLASVIVSTIPLLTPFLAYYFYREQLDKKNYLGILVSFSGVVLLVFIDNNAGHASWKGVVLMVLAVLSAQGYTLVLRRLAEKYNALLIVCLQNLIGALLFFPLFILLDFDSFYFSKLTLKDLLPVFYLSVFASGLAFIFFAVGVKNIGLSRAIAFTNFVPVVTFLSAVLMLDENISFPKIIGIALTISGLVLSQSGHQIIKKHLNRYRKNELYQ